MLDVALHTGTDNAAGGWIVVASLLSFVAGLGLGLSSDQLRELLGLDHTEPTDEPSN